MTAAPVPAPQVPRRPSHGSLVAMAIVALGIAVGALFQASEDEAVRSISPPAGDFRLDFPSGWSAVSQAKLAGAAEEQPDAMVRRSDGRGAVLVRRRGPLETSLADLGPALRRDVSARMPDARPVATRIVELSTGPALSYTFVRAETGLVQGIVVAPVGERTYTIESIALGGAEDVAADIGAIVRSFRR